jgi:hypothetical protein
VNAVKAHLIIWCWLNRTYRGIVHRHDGTFVASDESDGLIVRADTLMGLAEQLQRWPLDAERLPPSKYVKVEAAK